VFLRSVICQFFLKEPLGYGQNVKKMRKPVKMTSVRVIFDDDLIGSGKAVGLKTTPTYGIRTTAFLCSS
jgi:hypothetical protein